MTQLQQAFVNGATMMGGLVSALFFLRFWRKASDRFFGLFALAFFLLSIDRLALLLSGATTEGTPAVYLIRCAAFFIIIGAVIDKNQQRE